MQNEFGSNTFCACDFNRNNRIKTVNKDISGDGLRRATDINKKISLDSVVLKRVPRDEVPPSSPTVVQ